MATLPIAHLIQEQPARNRLLLGRWTLSVRDLKCVFPSLLIGFPSGRKHALSKTIFTTCLRRTLLPCCYQAHHIQFRFAALHSLLHLLLFVGFPSTIVWRR